VVLRELGHRDVGFVIAGIKEIDGAPVGDTITLENRPSPDSLPGFKQIKRGYSPVCFPSLGGLRSIPRCALQVAPE